MSEWEVVVAEARKSGLLGMTREASFQTARMVPGEYPMACRVLGDWYEERGRDVEAALARGGRPLGALRSYLESRLGREIGGGTIRVTVVLQ